MKTKIISKLAIIPAFIFSLGMMYGQTTEKNKSAEQMIHIKMVKNINGTETTVDTTIVGGSWTEGSMNMPDMNIDILIDSILNNGDEKMVIKTIEIQNTIDFTDSNIVIRTMDENDPELKNIMNEIEMEDKNGGQTERKIIIINEQGKDGNKYPKEQKSEFRIVIKTCNIQDLDKEDKKTFKSEGKTSFNENLKINQVDFYPNPNNGRFNLSFHLEKQGNTEISIFSMDGKNVYKEMLPDFTGNYRNEIDISKNANGVYFIKVTQGKNSWFKKMILE
jgi:hypothetical protein